MRILSPQARGYLFKNWAGNYNKRVLEKELSGLPTNRSIGKIVFEV
jgi:hypothetical protein